MKKLLLPLFAALLAAGCASSHPDGEASDVPREGLKPGECYTAADCRNYRAGGQPQGMCSLTHSGVQHPQVPDTCSSDADCTRPRERCVPTLTGRHCSPPGRCEACCKPTAQSPPIRRKAPPLPIPAERRKRCGAANPDYPFVAVEKITAQPGAWVGRKVSIQGRIDPGSPLCTRKKCSPHFPCCNRCGAGAFIRGVRIKGARCGGNDCGLTCDYPQGVLLIAGTLELERGRPVLVPTDGCISKPTDPIEPG